MTDTIALFCQERDGGCFSCGTTTASEYNCHHRQLKSGGGADTPENRITLHGTGTMGCHGYVHHHRSWAEENGYIVSRYADPRTIPVRHFRAGMVYLTEHGEMIPEADVVAFTLADRRPLTEPDLDEPGGPS